MLLPLVQIRRRFDLVLDLEQVAVALRTPQTAAAVSMGDLRYWKQTGSPAVMFGPAGSRTRTSSPLIGARPSFASTLQTLMPSAPTSAAKASGSKCATTTGEQPPSSPTPTGTAVLSGPTKGLALDAAIAGKRHFPEAPGRPKRRPISEARLTSFEADLGARADGPAPRRLQPTCPASLPPARPNRVRPKRRQRSAAGKPSGSFDIVMAVFSESQL